jgi:uncharacterized protein (TIGR00106 family)
MVIVAEISITPVGTDATSERRYVHAAVDALRRAGVQTRVGPFGTAIEVEDLEAVFEAVRQAHQATLAAGAQRVLLELRVDDRRDKQERIAEQVSV